MTGVLFQKVPGGFIPEMDQGYLIVFAQLPDVASLQRILFYQLKLDPIFKSEKHLTEIGRLREEGETGNDRAADGRCGEMLSCSLYTVDPVAVRRFVA